jgi:hypothetical protein
VRPGPPAAGVLPSLEALESSKIRLWSKTQFRLIAVVAKGFGASTCQGPHFPVGGLGVAESPENCSIPSTSEGRTNFIPRSYQLASKKVDTLALCGERGHPLSCLTSIGSPLRFGQSWWR